MDPVTMLLIVLGIAGAAGGYLWLRPRHASDEVFHFNCPGCGRRFRYRPKQIGHTGQCPHCNQRFTFPSPRMARP